MNYRKFTVFLISVCVLFFGNAIYTFSCGGGDFDPYDYYVSFFKPGLSTPGYEPFYYTQVAPFYEDPTPSEETANVADWQRFTGDKVTAADIRECIYEYSHDQLAVIAAGSTILPDSVKRNTFVQFLLKDKNQEVSRYLLFAKSCEPAATNIDRWSPPNQTYSFLDSLQREGEALYNKTKDKEIRERYAFQLVRLQHYSKEYAEAIKSFDKYFTHKSTPSLVYYKALSLKAGAMLRLKDSVQSAYIFSRVFEKAPSLRISSFTGVMWGNTTEAAIYPLCKDNHEKAIVAAIYGFSSLEIGPGSLNAVCTLDPASPALSILLSRQINILEDKYLNPYITDSLYYGKVGRISDFHLPVQQEVKSLQSWVDSIIDRGKIKDVDLWRVSSAYLSYMQRNYPAAIAQLNKSAGVKDPGIKDQWEIVNLLVSINQQKTIDSAFESRLLASFKWLDSKQGKRGREDNWQSPDSVFFFNKTYRNLLFAILAPRYKQQGDMVKEALIRARADVLDMSLYTGSTAVSLIKDDMKSAELLQLNSFLKKSSKTPYESYLSRFFPKKVNLDRVIGESYMRVHDFNNACTWLKKVPTASQAASYLVFQEQLQDFGQDTSEEDYKTTITEYQFCNRMVQLQAKMKITPVPAKVYYDYASALFSISYYGKTWYFVKDARPTTAWYSSSCDKDPFEKQYFGCYEAESYYLKAAQASTDREFRAKCAFMAARCSQKHIPDTKNNDMYMSALIHNRYFPLLTNNFGQTQFYQEVYGQCSYLRDYVRSTRKK
ncbi:hypothetical protein CLV51_102299 [Chitinophaga niastensis]|uniref:Uncharacterized protein n=1 Tax=Chitinophaga niastensis TaxID=536980 RepID=A0A2P8HMK4_CHINA|nr:hypothetical protein [Chitinophaga niastensis]PSL47452.1 hypothetical protein CLV51_102299 [Chitinophaga niastensis]